MAALTMGQQRDNLPPEVTRFIGRRREVPAIIAAIDQYRLVTLRGAGGVGKTRLALRVAREIRDTFADGSWLVELSALRDYELLPGAVAAALGLPDEAAGDPLEWLAASLAERELLLVLDTCEHLVEACGSLACTLLAAAPGLRILITSREPLGVPAEHALLIGPLELPAPGWSRPPGHGAAQADAVALFVDRAQAAVPEFALSTGQHRHGGRALPAARRHTARARARRGPAARHARRRDPRPADRPVPHPRRRPHRHQPAPHAAGRHRLELRPVHSGRAAAVGRALRVPGRLRSSRRPSGSAARAPPRP